ncbi:MAG: peptidase MA family metallohydrolase [bacterium]
MSLQIESAPEATPDGSERCSLVLLGFRNDLARHRVLSCLGQDLGAAPALLSLPHTLHDSVDAPTGARLAAELDRLGAVVRLIRLETPQCPPPPVEDWALDPATLDIGPIRSVPARFTVSARAVRLVVIVGVGVAWMIRLLRADDQVVTFPPRDSRAYTHSDPRAERTAEARLEKARTEVLGAQSRGSIKQLIAQGNLVAAQQAIERSRAAGDDAAVMALQGDVHGKRGDWSAARTAYERSVGLGSEDPVVFLALSDIYRRQGMQSAAVAMLHRAQQNGASGQDFEGLKEVVVAELDAESGFDSVSSPHFAISFDGGRDNAVAQLIVTQLEDAYTSVGHMLGQYPSHRTPVVLYAAQEFQRVTHAPGWAGALYDGRIKVPVRGLQSDSPDLARTLRHEYAHSLIMTISAGKCPVWLNEGVAMWAEEDRAGERAEWANAALQLHQPFKLAELESSFTRLSSLQAAAAYAQSYLAVRHIVARYGEHSLQQLLAAFTSSATTADAFRDALPVDLASFENDMRREQDGS